MGKRDSAFTGSCSTRAMASWGQHYPLRTAEKLSVFRKVTGWYGIQPYSTHLRQVIWDDLMIWFDDLNWVYPIFSGWDDETSIHSSWGLVKSTFRHREPLNTGWKSWDTNNAVQTALPKDGETFGISDLNFSREITVQSDSACCRWTSWTMRIRYFVLISFGPFEPQIFTLMLSTCFEQ